MYLDGKMQHKGKAEGFRGSKATSKIRLMYLEVKLH